MPLVKGRKASQRVSGGPADAMKARQEKHNLSELQVNWFGKANLNASKSDLIYKYHVVSEHVDTEKYSTIIILLEYVHCRYPDCVDQRPNDNWSVRAPGVSGKMCEMTSNVTEFPAQKLSSTFPKICTRADHVLKQSIQEGNFEVTGRS